MYMQSIAQLVAESYYNILSWKRAKLGRQGLHDRLSVMIMHYLEQLSDIVFHASTSVLCAMDLLGSMA